MAIYQDMEPCPGYRLTRKLGAGGFGEVWEGVGPDGSTLAFKFIDCLKKPGTVVVNEVRLLLGVRELQHPHLIKLLNIITGTNYVVMAMEKADGSLADVHNFYRDEAKTHVPGGYLCDLMEQAAVGLEFVAAQKQRGYSFSPTCLQHCDVKPSNLLLLGDVLKVADFGLCMPGHTNTVRNMVLGTPPYAPPELAEGRMTERTDQYSLAMTYCELRTGRLPFRGWRSARDTKPPDLNKLPQPERPIVTRALECNWLQRWPSCLDFVHAIRKAVAQSPFVETGISISISRRFGFPARV